jgi:hypothetical protein
MPASYELSASATAKTLIADCDNAAFPIAPERVAFGLPRDRQPLTHPFAPSAYSLQKKTPGDSRSARSPHLEAHATLFKDQQLRIGQFDAGRTRPIKKLQNKPNLVIGTILITLLKQMRLLRLARGTESESQFRVFAISSPSMCRKFALAASFEVPAERAIGFDARSVPG